jgi:hypothetical protein
LPLLTLSAGIALAFFFRQRYVSVTRPLLLLRERRAVLEADFAAARDVRIPPGKPYAAYDVTEDFRRETAALGRKIADLSRSSFNSPDAAAISAIEKHLEELESLAAVWREFPARLARLERARDELGTGPGTPRPFYPPAFEAPAAPAVREKATRLLQGEGITLARLKVIDVEVNETTERLLKWGALNKYAAWLSGVIHVPGQPDKLKTLVADKQSELQDADKRLFAVWDRLWRDDAYANGDTARELANLEKEIVGLMRHEVETTPLPELATADAGAVERMGINLAEAEPAETPGDARARADKFRALRRLLDWSGLILAAAIALYTGMDELYFGHAFGTPKDYVAAFLWGFGAHTVLTVLLGGLNMIWNSRQFSRQV